MKQEKKQTVFFDIEADTNSETYADWKKEVLTQLRRGTGIPVIAMGRGTGKSYATALYMATHRTGGESIFGSPWDEWEDTFVWPWNRKTSIESKKKIWGRVKVRYNKVIWEANGKQKQYATKKEVFQRKLKGKD